MISAAGFPAIIGSLFVISFVISERKRSQYGERDSHWGAGRSPGNSRIQTHADRPSPELPPVYSTPDMIRLMETAAFHALQPYCEGDEITVGTSINIQHRAASGIGAHIRAEAALESFDGRFFTLRVTARDDVQEIGQGTVGRAVVSVGRFLKKAQPKTADAKP